MNYCRTETQQATVLIACRFAGHGIFAHGIHAGLHLGQPDGCALVDGIVLRPALRPALRQRSAGFAQRLAHCVGGLFVVQHGRGVLKKMMRGMVGSDLVRLLSASENAPLLPVADLIWLGGEHNPVAHALDLIGIEPVRNFVCEA